MPHVLETERRTFEGARDGLLKADHGRFVLIRGTEICGIFDREEEGLAEGYRRFGPRASFYLHRIETEEEEVPVRLGIFSAAP